MKELPIRRRYPDEDRPHLKKRPVAFRYKNSVDVWVYTEDEAVANEAINTGHDSQALFIRDGT